MRCLLLIFACAWLGSSQSFCGPNEIFDQCGSSCEPTCRNPNPGVCSAVSVFGCRCRNGFFRDERGACVRNCGPPASCSELTCPLGTRCQMVEVPCTRQPCSAPIPQCVTAPQTTTRRPPPPPPTTRPPPPPPTNRPPPSPPTNRPPPPPPTSRPNNQRCGPNEVFDSCGSACEPSCSDPNPNKVCTLQCVAGCRCRQGFFRNDRGTCVANCGPPTTTRRPPPRPRPQRAAGPFSAPPPPQPPSGRPPPPPGPFPTFGPPRPPFAAPPSSPPPPPPPPPPQPTPTPTTCFKVGCPMGTHCEMVAEPCFFISCAVPRPMCVNDGQPRIPRSEKPAPAQTCANFPCPAGFSCEMVTTQCAKQPCPPPQPQCFRVLPPQHKCPRNESWRRCPTQCEPTCSDMNPKCNKACGEPKCQCDPGFFRNRSGSCVRSSECRPENSQESLERDSRDSRERGTG